ncbi:MAG: hypothetical protein HY315_04895 [Acidobacteria bacterium]|nr:hypothetical protein [Acidobacteriota bacterium]
MKKGFVSVASLIVLLAGLFFCQAYAQGPAVRTGEIANIDAAAKSFVIKTSRGETNILTTDQTSFKEGDKDIKFADLKVGDSIKVSGERKGNDVEANEVVREPGD